jgi:hypothetical protein
MTDFMVVEIKFNTNEPGFYPVRIGEDDLFIAKRDNETGDFTILQLTVENGEQYVGMPFYEFHLRDDEITDVKVLRDFDMNTHFRFIGYDRWIMRKDEKFLEDIKIAKS